MNSASPDLSELRIFEDTFVPAPVTPATVVLCGVWGLTGRVRRVDPLVASHQLQVKEVDLTFDGIAVTFLSQRDSAMFRLFYEGDTVTA